VDAGREQTSELGMMDEFSVDEILEIPMPVYDIPGDEPDYSPSVGSVSEFEEEEKRGLHDVRHTSARGGIYETPIKLQNADASISDRSPSQIALDIEGSAHRSVGGADGPENAEDTLFTMSDMTDRFEEEKNEIVLRPAGPAQPP
jgi:hypothetical protein